MNRFSSNPSDCTVSVVSPVMKTSSGTPVSSDDGFCGSSDISDRSNAVGHHCHLFPSFRTTYKHPLVTNGNDSIRRVRFNLIPKDPIENDPSNHTLRQFEQIYLSRKNLLDKQSMNSTVV